MRRRRRARGPLVLALLAALAGGTRPPARAETVTLKNGIVYSGTIDRDNTILSVYDGLRRVVLRDSKVATIEPGGGHGADERFHVDQPLEVHAGTMPAA